MGVRISSILAIQELQKLALLFLTGKLLFTTKDTKVTKGKNNGALHLFPPLVYSPAPTNRDGVVSFVFRIFPADYGRTQKLIYEDRCHRERLKDGTYLPFSEILL
jgi:hypothetical protein